MLKKIIIAILCLSIHAGGICTANDKKVGIVLLHGKWGHPSQFDYLAKTLRKKGYLVLAPMMPWSKQSGYDLDYSGALDIVTRNIRELRKSGSTFIVVAGRSMGANAAVAYAAYGQENVNAVIAVAPGHTPDKARYQDKIKTSMAKAKEMIAEGRGDRKWPFTDPNTDNRFADITMTADIFYSYNNPDGIASMPKSATRISRSIPLFWILANTDDVLYKEGRPYVFDKWPKHPSNRYMVLNSNHMEAADAAMNDIIEWIDALPSPEK